MGNLLGLGFAAAGAWLIAAALRARRAARAAPARAVPPLHPSLAVLAGVMPPLVTLGLTIAGIQLVLAFVITGGGVFTLVDLAGCLFLMAAYGVWITMKSRYRA